MAFEIGTKVRVAINARVTRDNVTPSLSSTQEVVETGDNSYAHFLYLNSPAVVATGTSGKRNRGDLVKAEFDAVVTGRCEKSPALTTEVREENDDSGFTHYLYLNSPSVTVLPEEPPQPAGGTRITPADTVFESYAVLNRIAELEDSAAIVQYRVTQRRNGRVLNPESGILRTFAEAVDFLNERDYNQTRFTIDPVKGSLSLEDQEELRLLKELNEAGRGRFGSPQWVTASVRLYNDEFFTEEWAKNRTISKLSIANYQLDEWPLSLIAWDSAVEELLNDKYTRIEFGGQFFWGSDTDTA